MTRKPPIPRRLLSRALAEANLAADEALYRAVSAGGPPAWRLWVNPPCVVVGKNQDPRREADLEVCARSGAFVLRRFTGGGAVYLDEGCLAWAIGLPGSGFRVPGSPSRGRGLVDYALFGGWIPDLLRGFGIEGRVEGNRAEVRGRKLSGMAARAGPKAILVHGTLLVSTDLAALREHLSAPPSQAEALPPAPRHVRSRPWPETTLSAEAGRDVSLDEAIEAARSALRGRFGFGEWAGAAAPAPGKGKGRRSGADD